MIVARLSLAALIAAAVCFSATFGTVVPILGGAADLALDEARGRLYLVNSNLSRIDVFSIRDRRFLSPIPTDGLPLAVAMSNDASLLYVTCFDASALNVIDLEQMQVREKVSLPARPEGVAVGGDDRVLISTIGTGQNNASNVLLIYDRSSSAARSLTSVLIAPPAPLSPLLPPPSGRVFLSSRSQLLANRDGNVIVGINIPNTNSRVVFVYEVASGTVLRSRSITNSSSVLSISPDGSRFMAGLTLFETSTLSVLAQQNMANVPYPFAQGTNFNTQQNQGGSVFAPDGSIVYSAFNFAPIQTPVARANVSQMMVSDTDNLLVRLGIQLAENMSGKMVITKDGGTIFALSESGLTIIPVSTMQQSPIAIPDRTFSLLLNDQCGAFGSNRTDQVAVRNMGRGRMNVTANLLQTTPTATIGLGGIGGPGGGAPGGGVVIVLPPERPGGIVLPAPVLPGGITTPQSPAISGSSPIFRSRPTADGAQIDLTFTSAAIARNPGTVSPTHTLVLQSEEAINIPPSVRVFQNFRNAEARGEIVPIEVGLTANEGLEDMLMDQGRQRLYIANSGLNRVEVFDIRRKELLPPIKVGQLPRSLAMTPDGSTLYVANSASEFITVIDLEKLQVSGRVNFPALPFNSGAVPMYASVMAAGMRGLQIIMNNGTLWKAVGNEAVPRAVSPAIGLSVLPQPRTMAATPNGEYILVLSGTGFVYLYDSMADEFVQGRQVFTTRQGYFGPVAAGPRGQFFLANGVILNQALTPVANTSATTATRPISAVATGSGNTFVRLVNPVRANAAAAVTEPPTVEMVDANSGFVVRSAPALEGPLSTQVGTALVNVNGRTMAVDAAGSTVYAVTTSGLSIVPLEVTPPTERPSVNPNGTVSLSSYVPSFAQGSLISVFGRNLGGDAAAPAEAPAMLGGTCVTINNSPLPLLMTSNGQLNAQIPLELATGRYSMVIRSVDRKAAAQAQAVTVAKYAPSVFADPTTKEAWIYRTDGSLVTTDRPAKRDEPLILFATGLGKTTGKVASGMPAPGEPLAETDPVKVYFGDPTWKQAEMIVEWSGLVPGLVGVYQINVRVPGERMRGDSLPVTLRIGGVDSQKTGPVVPTVAVQ